MSITKTANPASPGTVHAGDEITYTLVATNNGPSNAQNVTVSDAAPLGTTLVSFTPRSGLLPANYHGRLPFGTMAPGDGTPHHQRCRPGRPFRWAGDTHELGVREPLRAGPRPG